MTQTLLLHHERIDDIPLIIGLAHKLRLAEVLDRHMGTHRLQRGLNNGQLAVGWLAYILSQADHRKSAVRDWANGIPRTLEVSDHRGSNSQIIDFESVKIYPIFTVKIENPRKSIT